MKKEILDALAEGKHIALASPKQIEDFKKAWKGQGGTTEMFDQITSYQKIDFAVVCNYDTAAKKEASVRIFSRPGEVIVCLNLDTLEETIKALEEKGGKVVNWVEGKEVELGIDVLEIERFNPGTLVKVVDFGQCYTAKSDPENYGCDPSKVVAGRLIKNGMMGIVLGSKEFNGSLVLGVNCSDEHYVITSKGVQVMDVQEEIKFNISIEKVEEIEAKALVEYGKIKGCSNENELTGFMPTQRQAERWIKRAEKHGFVTGAQFIGVGGDRPDVIRTIGVNDIQCDDMGTFCQGSRIMYVKGDEVTWAEPLYTMITGAEKITNNDHIAIEFPGEHPIDRKSGIMYVGKNSKGFHKFACVTMRNSPENTLPGVHFDEGEKVTCTTVLEVMNQFKNCEQPHRFLKFKDRESMVKWLLVD